MRALFLAAALVAFVVAPAQAQQADASLSVSEYASRGFPAINRDWTPEDYTVAMRVLTDVPLAELPRTNSEKSGAVIDRMVNRNSLAACQDRAAALIQRMQLCAPALGAISQILMRYSVALDGDVSRGEDNLRIMSYCLLIAAELSDMMTAFTPTLDPNDPDYARRLGGLNQARGGLAQMIEGALMTLEAPAGVFPEHARPGVATTLAEVYARMMSNVATASQAPFDARLRAIAVNDRNPDVRAALAAFAG